MTRRLFCLTVVWLAWFLPATLSAQSPARNARLLVTVIDPTGAIIPDANVTIVGLEATTKAAAAPAAKTTDKGLATFDALAPGRYSITADFPGFKLGLVRDIRLRSGDNRHV